MKINAKKHMHLRVCTLAIQMNTLQPKEREKKASWQCENADLVFFSVCSVVWCIVLLKFYAIEMRRLLCAALPSRGAGCDEENT